MTDEENIRRLTIELLNKWIQKRQWPEDDFYLLEYLCELYGVM